MAQYYNVVTNPNGTYTIEDLQQAFTLDGQRVQFVFEDINNGPNVVSQPILYTTTTDNNETALFSQINLGPHVATAQLEARPSVYIIKTNDSPVQQNIFTKVETGTTQGVNSEEVKDQISVCYAPTQVTNNESIEVVIKKDPSPIKNVATNTVRCQQPATSTPLAARNFVVQGSTKTPTRLIPLNKSVAGVAPVKGPLKPAPQGANTQAAKAAKMRRASNIANSSNVAVTSLPRASSGVGATALVTPPRGPQARPSIHCETPQRNSLPATSKNTPSQQQQNQEQLISLSERIRLNNLKQRQQNEQRNLQQQKQPPPVMAVAPTTRLVQPTQAATPQRQQQQQQQQRNMGNVFGSRQQPQQQQQQQQQHQQQQLQLQQQQQLQLQQQQLQLQRQQQQQLQQLQRQTVAAAPQHHLSRQVVIADAEEPMEVDNSDMIEQLERLNQLNSSKSESEENSSESFAYLQQEIDDPSTAIVQHQITGNEAKMLVILENGEQRLITFEVPKEDCTVQDLLEQASILTSQEPRVSLVSDPTLNINYIVDVTKGSSFEEEQQHESASSDASSVTNCVEQHKTPVKNNANLPPVSTAAGRGPPKYISGKLAVCPYCGMIAPDFNACLRCKRKLPENVRTMPAATNATPKKDGSAIPVDTFYKKSEANPKCNPDGTARRGRGRGRGGVSARATRQIKEPECLTISSDEEDENKKQKQQEDIKCDPSALIAANNQEDDGVLDKEPLITAKTISALKLARSTQGGEKDDSADAGNPIKTALLCRTVRIGSYKYVPTDEVELTSNGLKLEVPLLEDDKSFITVEIKLEDLVAVLMHFQKSMPVLFFYPDVATGLRIRDVLGMQDPKGPYFDPAGKDNTHKRITLLPEKVSDESKILLKQMYKDVFTELNSKEANDILVRASPKSATYPKYMQTRSETKRPATSNNANLNGEIQTITVYPAPPAKGGIAINTEDYACLAEDQFLNDVIIDFYLKYLMLEVLSHNNERTHVFSSYFYKRLTSPNSQAGGNPENLSAASRRHARVQKWTKNVNIFEKDFIVIPINESAHWFLAIICYPGLVGKVTQNVETKTLSQKMAEKKKRDAKAQAVTIGSTTITPITVEPIDDGSERDEAEGDEDEIESDSDEEDETESKASTEQAKASAEQAKPNTEQAKASTEQAKASTEQAKKASPQSQNDEINKVPCILIFDSLAGASRVRVVATLRDYLSCEYKAKMKADKEFSKNTIKGACPKVPQQSNYTDCGLYVLQYVESFFMNPIKDYKLPIKTLKNWFEEIVVTRKREEIANLLKNLVSNTKRAKPITLPNLIFPTQDGKLKKKPESEAKEAKAAEAEEKKKVASEAGQSEASAAAPSTEKAEDNGGGSGDGNATTSNQVAHEEPSSTDVAEPQKVAASPTTAKTPAATDAMAFLKSKRIPRLQKASEDPEDKQAAKKHKGESFDSCK